MVHNYFRRCFSFRCRIISLSSIGEVKFRCPLLWLTAISLTFLSVDERIKIAHNVYSSHVFDVLLSSPSITAKAKRTIVMDYIGSYHLLVDDRIGSHIVDRCWEYADTYLKVRSSMISGELFLMKIS